MAGSPGCAAPARSRVSEAATDEYVAKQIRYDPDLWVIEFEAADYLPPFEGRIR